MQNYIIDNAFGTSLRSHIPDMIAHGLYGAIWRVGQGLYHAIDNISDQLAVSKEYNLPYGLYYAFHPWYDAQKQVDRFLANLQGSQPTSIWLDFELHGDESSSSRDAVYHKVFDLVREKVSTIPVVGNYSGKWFIEEWCPEMKLWINQAPYWNASYPVFNPQTWAQFDEMLQILPTPQYVGYPKIAMWQFAGSLITPMVPHQVDYSRIDDPAMYQYLFKGGVQPNPLPIPVPVPTETYQVIVDSLTVRAGPGVAWAVAYYLHKNDKITVYEKSGNWGRFATGRWCNISSSYCVKV